MQNKDDCAQCTCPIFKLLTQLFLELYSNWSSYYKNFPIVPLSPVTNLLLNKQRAVLGNIDPRSRQYGPSAARSEQKQLRANIPQ